MPSLDPITQEPIYKIGSRQRREENLQILVNFLNSLKNINRSEMELRRLAEKFCNSHFQYGYVTRKDISEQALILTNNI